MAHRDADTQGHKKADHEEPEGSDAHPSERGPARETRDRHDERRGNERNDDHADELDEQRPERLEHRGARAEHDTDENAGEKPDRDAIMDLQSGPELITITAPQPKWKAPVGPDEGAARCSKQTVARPELASQG